MINPIMNHMNQCFDQLLKPQPIRTYEIRIRKDGMETTWKAKGITLGAAEDAIKAYVGGEIFFLSGKDITNESGKG